MNMCHVEKQKKQIYQNGLWDVLVARKIGRLSAPSRVQIGRLCDLIFEQIIGAEDV